MVFQFTEAYESFTSSFFAQKFYIQLYFQMQSTFLIYADLLSFYCRKYHLSGFTEIQFYENEYS